MNPLPEFTFFTDRDLGNQVPQMLSDAGLSVVRHDDLFSPTTLDTEWLCEIGKKDWIALTHNKRIRYVSEERDMIMRAGVALLVLAGSTTHAELATNFVQTIPRIGKFLRTHSPPYMASVYRPNPIEKVKEGVPGRIEMRLSYDEWVAINL